MVFLACRHELVLARHQLLSSAVDIGGETWRVKYVELDQLGKRHPLLINRAVTSEIDALEAREFVLGVLVHAKRHLAG